MPRDGDFKQTLCADTIGFSLHAAARCGAADRQALEQRCRYITRSALAHKRVQTTADGQFVPCKPARTSCMKLGLTGKATRSTTTTFWLILGLNATLRSSRTHRRARLRARPVRI